MPVETGEFCPEKDELLRSIDYVPPEKPWMETKPVYKKGTYCFAAREKHLKYMGFPNPREWEVGSEDWQLPENWKEIFIEGMENRLKRWRSFRLFLDICVRCGACADKCHFFIGGGDPKNMPVLRAELFRSLYRRYFTTSGKVLGKLAGARDLDEDVLREIFYYAFHCTECRRCSVFCPYGIDTAEITMFMRELLTSLGLHVAWTIEPVANCQRTGNHLGIQPHAFKETFEFLEDDIEDVTGIKIETPINQKGADIFFVAPSGDYFGTEGTYTCAGYMMLFEWLKRKYGFTYTWSAYAGEGGNFGLFTSNEAQKRLSAKIYAEAKRLGVKWIIGGECGHMWRDKHQYMDTQNGPADFLEVPVNPITGTVFENARSTKMVHICEFTADLIKHGKLDLDPSRNDHLIVTYHDSCNPARAMGLLEEPRYCIRACCNNFYEMPENTIREKTFCCAGGSGVGSDEFLEMRMRGGICRGSAVKYVHEKHGVNRLLCICAIDRATLVSMMEYWCPAVDVGGIHELIANALVFPGEKSRTIDLRGLALKKPVKGVEVEEEEMEE